MKVLVTGGLGKVGQWVVRELLGRSGLNSPHEVTVLDRTQGPADSDVKYLVGDIEDLGQVFEAVAGHNAVIHLAAIRNPNIAPSKTTFQTNIVGTFNVHEAAYVLGIKRVVSTSSTAILGWTYGERDFEPEYLPIDEDHPVRPQDVYALSKEAGEAIARSYARKGLETIVLRPGGVVTPEALEQMKREGGRRPTKFHTYSYIDARDLAVAFRLAVERPIPSGTVLFVVADDSTVSVPLCDLLPQFLPKARDKASSLLGTKAAISNARIKALLNWKPVYSWRNHF